MVPSKYVVVSPQSSSPAPAIVAQAELVMNGPALVVTVTCSFTEPATFVASGSLSHHWTSVMVAGSAGSVSCQVAPLLVEYRIV